MESVQRLILFSVFLAGLAHITFSAPNQYPREYEFTIFRNRLRKALENPRCVPLMTMKGKLIEYLGLTSDSFKDFCLEKYQELFDGDEDMATVNSLNGAIESQFAIYAKKFNLKNRPSHILTDIQLNDPIGLNVYLTKNNLNEYSETFRFSVRTFHETMEKRLLLIRLQTDDSAFNTLLENIDGPREMIPRIIREGIATEFASIRCEIFELFAKIAMEQLGNITMYYATQFNNQIKYKQHKPINADDVQILLNPVYDDAGKICSRSSKCIFYRGNDSMVCVYSSDSSRAASHELLTKDDMIAIKKLYPSIEGFDTNKRPITMQNNDSGNGFFSIAYATMLLLKEDPSKTEIKLNTVHGDPTLYMRIHLLKMLANRKIDLLGLIVTNRSI